MGQPKNRRRRARRLARLARPVPPAYILHMSVTGETRNPIGKVASLDTTICVGFGSAVIERDGPMFCDGDHPERRGVINRRGYVTLRSVEKHIRRTRTGHHRWTASVYGPLWDAAWERKRPGKWVCISAGDGFA